MIFIPLEAVKSLTGFKEVKPNKDTATHMIYTVTEHNNKNKKIRELEQQIVDLENDYKIKINNIVAEANKNTAIIQKNTDDKINETNLKYNRAIREIQNLENINSNLLRISKERANAERKLTPKKQHCGYVLQQVEEATFIHRDTHKRNLEVNNFPCWKVRFQTPYIISFELNVVNNLVDKDYYNILANIIDIKKWYLNGQLEKLESQKVIEAFKNNFNFYFKKTLKMNAIRGFWEVEYWTKNIIKYSDEILSTRAEAAVANNN